MAERQRPEVASDGGPVGESAGERAAGAAAPRLPEWLEGAWAAAHGLAEDAEVEVQRLFSRLSEWTDAPRTEAERRLDEVRLRFADNRRQLERRLEEGVRAYLSRLRFPSREELAALNAHLDGLEARVGELERGWGSVRPPGAAPQGES